MGCDLIKYTTAMKSLQVSQLFGTSFKNLGGNQILREFKHLVPDEDIFDECLKLYHIELTDPNLNKDQLNTYVLSDKPISNLGKRINPEDEDPLAGQSKDLGQKRFKVSVSKALKVQAQEQQVSDEKVSQSSISFFSTEDLAELYKIHTT